MSQLLLTYFALLELTLREKQILLLNEILESKDEQIQRILDLLTHELCKPVQVVTPLRSLVLIKILILIILVIITNSLVWIV